MSWMLSYINTFTSHTFGKKKNYKFILITLSFLVLVGFMVVTYLDIPAPDKLQTKILDVNDDEVR